jgi:16S rRNA processing protein RimM
MRSRSAKTEPASLAATVVVGRVLRPHGLRGDLVVEVLSDVPGRLGKGSDLLVRFAGGGAGGELAPVRVAASRRHPEGRLLRLAGVEERERAAELRGAWLEVERSRVPAAPAGAFYEHELVGCRCRDRRAGPLGEVTGVVNDGGGALLEVKGERGTLLVPLVESFLRRVDRDRRAIELDLPAGLVETCASPS